MHQATVDPVLGQGRGGGPTSIQERLNASRWPGSQCWPNDGGEPTSGQHRA